MAHRDAFFNSWKAYFTGEEGILNRGQSLSKQGVYPILTTLRLYAKCFTPIPKTLYAYTQNELLLKLWGTIGALLGHDKLVIEPLIIY